MPLVAAYTPPPIVNVREDSGWCDWQRDTFWSQDLFYCDPTRHMLKSFRVGEMLYEGLRPIHATFEPPVSGRQGRFIVAGLEEYFVGRGNTFDDAYEDWTLIIDFSIQQLLATQDFERTAEQNHQWHLLSQYFDLNEIRYSRPLRIRAYGRLLSNRGHQYRVRWIDGTKSKFTRDRVPEEVVGFRVGQPFEAVVLRDARTWQLLRVESAFATSSLPHVTEADANEFLRDVPSSNELPELPWD